MNTNTIEIVIGIDLGDKNSVICVLDKSGTVEKSFSLSMSYESIIEFFTTYQNPSQVTVAMENGSQSLWISELLRKLGFDVLVGNARKLRAIWDSPNKHDFRDAEMLARIARFDRKLFSPIRHRSRPTQLDLVVVKARDGLVTVRVDLVNTVRGLAKSFGVRIGPCSTDAFAKVAASSLSKELTPALRGLLTTISHLTTKIRCYDKKIERMCDKRYPETKCLRQIPGVGPITALAFILTLESSDRFSKSRAVGSYLGLVPKRDQSGESDKQLSITKAGNSYMRHLLVNAANYIMGPFGPDSDLRRYGERIASRGGKIARRKAKTAVARKLAVLLHHLWKHNEIYYPLMKEARKEKEAA